MWKIKETTLLDFKKKIENTWCIVHIPNISSEEIINLQLGNYFVLINKNKKYYLCFLIGQDGDKYWAKNVFDFSEPDRSIINTVLNNIGVVYYSPNQGYFNSFTQNNIFAGCFKYNRLSEVQWKLGLTTKVACIENTSNQMIQIFSKWYNSSKNNSKIADFEVFVPKTISPHFKNINFKNWGTHLKSAFNREFFDICTSEAFIRDTITCVALSSKVAMCSNFYGKGYMLLAYPHNIPFFTFDSAINFKNTIKLTGGKIINNGYSHVLSDFISYHNRENYPTTLGVIYA